MDESVRSGFDLGTVDKSFFAGDSSTSVEPSCLNFTTFGDLS